jgi:hypothetical protein
LKKRNFTVFLISIFLILVMVATGCVVNAANLKPADPTNPTAPTAATKEKSYNCLNPVGVQPPVTVSPLAARLDTMDGKIIYVVQGEADPVVMPALYTALQATYPKTTWNYYQPSSSFGASAPDAQTKAEAKAVIRGNAW